MPGASYTARYLSHNHLPDADTGCSSRPSSSAPACTRSLSPLPISLSHTGLGHMALITHQRGSFQPRIPSGLHSSLHKKVQSYDPCTDRGHCDCPTDTRYLSKTRRKGTVPDISQQNKPDRLATQKHTPLGLQGNHKYNNNCSHCISTRYEVLFSAPDIYDSLQPSETVLPPPPLYRRGTGAWKAKSLTHGYRAEKWQSQNANPDGLTPRAQALNVTLPLDGSYPNTQACL